MTQTIARLYRSHDTAMAAVDALKEHGFSDGSIYVVAPPEAPEPRSEGPGTSTDQVSTADEHDSTADEHDSTADEHESAAAKPASTSAHSVSKSADPVLTSILAAGVSPNQASIYAEGVRRGEVLVAVQPLFGRAQSATTILDSFDPIAVALPEAEPASVAARDAAAPLSSALGMKVLSSDPTPLSSWLKWRTLMPELRSSPALEGIRKRSGDAAPLSNKLGMSVLSAKAAPLSARFGWRVLSDNPAPLSTWRGWRLLSNNPTPLSSLLGWRVLLK